jgi:hypothetical protein
MGRAFLVVLAISATTFHAAAADPVKVNCAEWERLSGQKVCDLFPEVKVSQVDYDKALRSHNKRQCLENYRRLYGHCPDVRQLLWSKEKEPPECVGRSPSECD